MSKQYLVSEEQLERLEKFVRFDLLLWSEQTVSSWPKATEIGKLLTEIRIADERKSEAVQAIIDALKPFLVVHTL